MQIKRERLRRIVKNFKNKKVLVVGDLILDHYIFGQAERISPEAPVPVVWANRESFLGGGAVNVANNLVSLGADVYLCGVIGEDEFGKKLIEIIKKRKIKAQLIVKDKKRPTTIKTRIVATHQQVVRVDWESREFLSLALNQKILKNIRKMINEFDGVIIEDYGKGVINPYLVEELVRLSKKNNKVITVDPKEEHFDYYENVTALTPNLKEAQTAVNMRIKSKEEINLLGKILKERLKPSCLLITLGEEGMRLFLEKEIWHIPTYALEVFDVTGAGDTVIASFTLALLAGASFLEAAIISNLCAGIVVTKFGPATATISEIEEKIKITKINVERMNE